MRALLSIANALYLDWINDNHHKSYSSSHYFRPHFSFSQKYLDRKITVNYVDTSKLYERLRLRFIKEGYIIQEDHNPDTITTYPRDKRPLGYMHVIAAIRGDKVTFWGYWASRERNVAGDSRMPINYKPVIYYEHNAGIGWRELRKVAATLGSNYDYGK